MSKQTTTFANIDSFLRQHKTLSKIAKQITIMLIMLTLENLKRSAQIYLKESIYR